MSEIVQRQSENTVRELEALRQTKIISEEMINCVIRARKQMENKINNNFTKNIEDYKKYILHEIILLQKIRKIRDKKKISDKEHAVDYSIIARIKRLYEAALQRFTNDYSLHEDFFKFCRENKFSPAASQAVDNMMKLFSYKPEVWKLAAAWYDHINLSDKALQILNKGLTLNPKSTLLYNAAIELELSLVTHLGCPSDEKSIKENKCCDRIQTYVNLILTNINQLEYIISVLTMLEEYQFTNPAQHLILEHLLQNHAKEDIVWHAMARREKKGLHFVSDPSEKSRAISFNKACIIYCIDKYEQGLKLVTPDNKKKLWSHYLEALIDMRAENQTTFTTTRHTFLKNALEQAHMDKCLEEKHYKIWVDIISEDEARNILKEATSNYPQSEELWKLRLVFAIKIDKVKDVNAVFNSGVLALKEKAISLWLMFLRFHLLISENDKMREIFEEGIKEPREVSDVLKPKYIEWIAFHEGMDAARARYRTLAVEKPYCKELHLVMSKLEFSEMNIDHDSWQKVHELACEQFGTEDIDVRIDYIKFILFRKPIDMEEKIAKIYRESEEKLPSLLWQHFKEMYDKLLAESK